KMNVSRSDRNDISQWCSLVLDYLNRDRTLIRCRSITESQIRIRSPGPNRPVRAQSCACISMRSDCDDVGQVWDLSSAPLFGGCSVAQLSIGVITPPPYCAV